MIKFPVHNLEGEKTGTINLPGNIFGIEINSDVIYQVVNAQYANSRFHLAHTKNRGEVSGSGKKPWRQRFAAKLPYFRPPTTYILQEDLQTSKLPSNKTFLLS